MKKSLIIAVIIASAVVAIAACSKGPAEPAGQSVDNAGKAVVDTVTPTGPLQKAGKTVDKAANTAADSMQPS